MLLKQINGSYKFKKGENQIVDARVNFEAVSKFGETELRDALQEAVVRISVVCGGCLPTTKFVSDVLNDELAKYILKNNFENLTVEEIVLAFRLNCFGILFDHVNYSGCFVNIEYISKVLTGYMEARNLLDGKLKNLMDGY
jgi:hypothetical protein